MLLMGREEVMVWRVVLRLVYILAHDDQNKSESTALVKSTTMAIVKKLTLGVKYLFHRKSTETEDRKNEPKGKRMSRGRLQKANLQFTESTLDSKHTKENKQDVGQHETRRGTA